MLFGYWYLRGCVVKPEYRGQGLQSELIQERINYLVGKTNAIRVSVFPTNTYSINNIKSRGFLFEKNKKLSDGSIIQVYKKEI